MTLENPSGAATPWGWQMYVHPQEPLQHLVPLWDIGQHSPCEHCGCRPEEHAHGAVVVWVHNAFDGRERYEQSGAKKN